VQKLEFWHAPGVLQLEAHEVIISIQTPFAEGFDVRSLGNAPSAETTKGTFGGS
jgi:hypothetical protein